MKTISQGEPRQLYTGCYQTKGSGDGEGLEGATIGLQISHREGANFLWFLYGLDMGILYLEKRAKNASRVGPRMDLCSQSSAMIGQAARKVIGTCARVMF